MTGPADRRNGVVQKGVKQSGITGHICERTRDEKKVQC